MATEAYRRLLEFEGRPGVSLAPKGEALNLTFLRGDILVSVVVPESVLEWYVEVERRGAKSRATDWCDYDGYDDTPITELERDMADDVAAFVNQLIGRELRYVEDIKRPTRGILEWFVNDQWTQAVPFVVSAA